MDEIERVLIEKAGFYEWITSGFDKLNNGISVRAAINQTHAKHNAPVAGAREIAFFPPVTGG